MENHTLSISNNSSITFVNASVVIRCHLKESVLKGKFLIGLIFIIGSISFLIYYKLYESLVSILLPIFILCLGFYNIKTELKYLLRFKWMHEELIISASHLIYKINGKAIFKREARSWMLCFNIENKKQIKPDYNEIEYLFNPMICIIDDDYCFRNYCMNTLGFDDCMLIMDELEKWYSMQGILDRLKIYRPSTQEITLYEHRYWKSEFMRKSIGIY